MLKVATATPDAPAQVLVRKAAELVYGDRILRFRDGGRWAEFVTVINVEHDEPFAEVHYVLENDATSARFSAWGHAPVAVLTAGVCDNRHSGRALMCTPAPFRLDNHPWPGHSIVCDAHRKQMCAAIAWGLP